jgi:long-chain acyl-CoA synthetase
MSTTRYEWTLIDYAIWSAGGVSVPVYETSSADQVRWILSDSGAKAAFFETAAHVATFEKIAGDVPHVAQHWHIENDGLAALIENGREISAAELDERLHSRHSSDIATLVYTSGTTGQPKGCELTHANLWGTAVSAAAVLPELFNDQGSTLLFLPLAHVFGRLIQGACFENRVRMGHTHDLANLVTDLGEFSPTFLLSVPRVFEKVFNTYKQQAHSTGKGKIFDRAEKVAIDYSRALDGRGPSPLLKAKHALFEKVLYGPRLRAPLGGSLMYAVSGGAPLGERLGHFFRGIGITVCEGYGLTESTGGACVNLPHAIRIGSVGRPIPGTTVRIAEDGEVLMRGPHILRGYWHNETATKEAIDEDGFFHTGDIGELDADGYLSITGRKKELIVTAGGKNVAPAVLEDRLRAHPLVSQCVVVGDAKPFIACLITLDVDAIPAFLKAHQKPLDTPVADLTEDPDMLAAIQGAVDDANHAVSKAEAIRKFVILPVDFTEEGGELTPSLKLKRTVVMKEFSSEVEALYR